MRKKPFSIGCCRSIILWIIKSVLSVSNSVVLFEDSKYVVCSEISHADNGVLVGHMNSNMGWSIERINVVL